MWRVVRHLGMSGCLCVHLSVHLGMYVHWYIHTSISTYVGYLGRPSVWLSGISVSTSVCPYIHPLSVRSCIIVGLSYQLISIIVGHMQCHVRLVWVPGVFWVMVLVQFLCVLGLEANRHVLMLHAVETMSSFRHLLSWFIFFLCSVFMSQATASTTVLPVTVVCSAAFSHYICYHGPNLDGATINIRSAWWGSTTIDDTEGHKKGCWPCHPAAAATLVQMPLQAYAMGPLQISLFQNWALHQFSYICWYLLWCMLSTFRCHTGCHIH